MRYKCQRKNITHNDNFLKCFAHAAPEELWFCGIRRHGPLYYVGPTLEDGLPAYIGRRATDKRRKST